MSDVIALAIGTPVPSSMPGHCQYPWCQHPNFTTDSSEVVVRATLDGPGTITGTMHVSHTNLADRYAGGTTEYFDASVAAAIADMATVMDVTITEVYAMLKQLAESKEELTITAERRTPTRDVFYVSRRPRP